MILACQAYNCSPGHSSYQIAVKLGGDESWGRISDKLIDKFVLLINLEIGSQLILWIGDLIHLLTDVALLGKLSTHWFLVYAIFWQNYELWKASVWYMVICSFKVYNIFWQKYELWKASIWYMAICSFKDKWMIYTRDYCLDFRWIDFI